MIARLANKAYTAEEQGDYCGFQVYFQFVKKLLQIYIIICTERCNL